MTRKLLSYFSFFLCCCNLAEAETITLKDGSTFEGAVTHFYDSTLHVSLPSGDTLILTRAELVRIDFQEQGQTSSNTTTSKTSRSEQASPTAARTPTAETPYATPKKTVEAWVTALKRGDWEAMADCFVAATRAQMLEKLRDIPEEQRDQMVRDAAKTDFRLSRPRVDGEKATLKLIRRVGKTSTDEELRLQREAGDWRLIPN
jgi:hypothetical protein